MQSLTRLLRHVSLRTKLVALMAALMMAGIVATAWGTAQSTRSALIARVDADLRANSRTMTLAMDEAIEAGQSYITGTGTVGTATFYGAVFDEAGQQIFENSVGGTDRPAISSLLPDTVVERERTPFTVPGTTATSRGWRVIAVADLGSQGSAIIATPLAETVGNTERAVASILLVGTLATMVMSLIGYAVTTRAFRPLIKVERTAAAIAGGDLARRVEEYPIETEVGRLSASLNAMLARIEASFRAQAASEDKMRRFVQDASHELRTPLVTIRGYSELYRHGGIPAGEPLDQAIGRIENEAKRMSQLVEDLLMLARLDEERPLESEPVDLLVIAGDAVADARVNAPDRQVRLVGIDGAPPRSAPTMGDESKLRQVVVNLMTNALRYTPAGTPIEVAVGVREVIAGHSDAVLAIVDHGHGIPAEDAARIFERFYRGDISRQRETGGTGLGLAIVAAIAKQHDGGIRLSETPEGGATMSLRVPYVAPPEAVDEAEAETADEAEPARGREAAPVTRSLQLLRSTFSRRGERKDDKGTDKADKRDGGGPGDAVDGPENGPGGGGSPRRRR
ncbi:sensor histidine kinase [Galactobacter valiniphilus]|uniref:histidine kinase n=1 Tax=Galactobacter valiniphilus TaxID=2676122 RepID=A0A399JAW7_9MICC|nr:HAMP domain-containing sensor histidine kinase [Galactobacter valiniphilus]RII42374.1 sensor histidine kinase [Galactobacter valiniphilus]